jgi:hypothetical protein
VAYPNKYSWRRSKIFNGVQLFNEALLEVHQEGNAGWTCNATDVSDKHGHKPIYEKICTALRDVSRKN